MDQNEKAIALGVLQALTEEVTQNLQTKLYQNQNPQNDLICDIKELNETPSANLRSFCRPPECHKQCSR